MSSKNSALQWLYHCSFERDYARHSLRRRKLQVSEGGAAETLAYFDSGPPRRRNGEPILLLHGFGGDKRNWLRMAKRLSRRHRLVAVDLAGHGESSDAADGNYSFERQAQRARAVAASLGGGLASYHVLGHSMGGAVAIKLATLYPEQVLSVGLIASAGARGQHTDDVLGYLHRKTDAVNPLIVSARWSGGGRLRFVTHPRWHLRLVARLFDRAMTDEALHREGHFKGIFDYLENLETTQPLTCADLDRDRPTFYLYGAEDRVLRPYWAECFASGAPDVWKIKRLGGVGHTPILERPKQTAELYLEFLHGLAGRPA